MVKVMYNDKWVYKVFIWFFFGLFYEEKKALTLLHYKIIQLMSSYSCMAGTTQYATSSAIPDSNLIVLLLLRLTQTIYVFKGVSFYTVFPI